MIHRQYMSIWQHASNVACGRFRVLWVKHWRWEFRGGDFRGFSAGTGCVCTSVRLDLAENEIFSETDLRRRELDNLLDSDVHSKLETDVRVVGAVDTNHVCNRPQDHSWTRVQLSTANPIHQDMDRTRSNPVRKFAIIWSNQTGT